jgi:ClpP class serine protease
MAVVADTIVAGPLAVLGSIGVVTGVPNFYERLTKEGIVVNTVTAGKFKRTLTPTSKTTDDDLAKTKEDLEDILVLFKRFVGRHRPALDIDKVATGEVWFGPDALALGLCDELRTPDDVLRDLMKAGRDVFTVSTEKPRGVFSLSETAAQAAALAAAGGLAGQTLGGGGLQGLAGRTRAEVVRRLLLTGRAGIGGGVGGGLGGGPQLLDDAYMRALLKYSDLGAVELSDRRLYSDALVAEDDEAW